MKIFLLLFMIVFSIKTLCLKVEDGEICYSKGRELRIKQNLSGQPNSYWVEEKYAYTTDNEKLEVGTKLRYIKKFKGTVPSYMAKEYMREPAYFEILDGEYKGKKAKYGSEVTLYREDALRLETEAVNFENKKITERNKKQEKQKKEDFIMMIIFLFSIPFCLIFGVKIGNWIDKKRRMIK